MIPIKLGRTDYTRTVFIPDPASTDGSGKTGLVAANLTVSYTRVETDNDVTVTDVTSSLNNLSALTDAHNDWGLKEVSNTLAPGLYRLDIADAVFASGAWSAVVYVMITSSAAAASPIGFELVAYDPLDATRLGLSALPNAAADAAGGLPISDAGGLDLDARLDVAVSSRLAPTVASRTLDVTATGAAGVDWGNVENQSTAVNLSATNIDTDQVVASVSGAVGSVTGAVGSVTGNVGGNVTGSVGSLATQAKADVNAEVDAALADARLDELLVADSDIDGAAPPAVGSVFHELLSKTAGSFTYDQTTDSLEALRDRGDAAWITAVGFSTLTQADIRSAVGLASANLDTQLDALPTAAENATAVWASVTRTLTALDEDVTTIDLDATIRSAVGLASANLDAQFSFVPDAVWDYLLTGSPSNPVGSAGAALIAAGSAGDPWSSLLPGAYGAGTAGFIVGTNINATISSRLAAASYTAPLDAAGTRAAVGLASANLDTQLATIDQNVDDVELVTAKLDTALEVDGPVYRFTTNALEQAPSGSGSSPEVIADAVWDYLLTGSPSNPVGSAGWYVVTRLDVAVSTRLASASYVAPLDAAGTRAAIGLASANLDTQFDALPTAAENATQVWAAGTRTLTSLDEDNTTLDLDSTIRAALGLGSANLDTQLGDVPTAEENADALLGRNVAGGSSSGRLVKEALYALRNKVTSAAGVFNVYQTDDSTLSWTGTTTTAPGDPLTSIDPA